MSFTVSPQVRILAIVGLLGTLAIFIGSRILATHGGTAVPTALTRHHASAATKTTVAHATKTKHGVVVTHKTVKTKAVLTAPPKPIVHRVVSTATNGLPPSLAAALNRYDIVVVALYVPGSPVDSVAMQEARAGAALAGAGYVALDVFNETNAARLATAAGIGVAQDPAVLIFKRPARVLTKIDGYADRETVAQAAQNAAS